jgi:hypothetical protein
MVETKSMSARLLKFAGDRVLDCFLALHWDPVDFKRTLNALEAHSTERSDAVRALVDHLELAASSRMMDGALTSLEDLLPPRPSFQPLRVGVVYSLHGDAAGADAARAPGPEVGAWSLAALHTAAWCLATQNEWKACFAFAEEAAKRPAFDPELEPGHDLAALFGLAAHHVGEHALAVASFRRSFELNIGFPSVWLSVFAEQSAVLAGIDDAERETLMLEQQRVLERAGSPVLAVEIAAKGAIAAFENEPEQAKARFEAAVKAASEPTELTDVKKLAEAVRTELGGPADPTDLAKWLHGFVTGGE